VKSKYETHVKPYIALVKSMRIDGAREEDIYRYLGVGHSAFNDYKNKHEELSEALKYSKQGLVSELEKSLFQLAKGGYTSKKITKKYMEDIDGNRTGLVEVTETIQEHTPQSTALIFSLKNLEPRKWADKVEVTNNVEIKDFTRMLDNFVKKL